jgi:hypothetical protein
MYRIPGEFSDRTIVALPISRLVLDSAFRVGSFYFFPAEEFDVQSMRPVAPIDLEAYRVDEEQIHLQGQSLRWAAASVTGFCTETLEQNAVVVFEADIDWSTFDKLTHDDDVAIIAALSAEAERALDIVRFCYCRFDLPDTLPGIAGTWEGSGQFMGALVYRPDKKEAYLLAGSAIHSSVIVKGIGLHISSPPELGIPEPRLGPVSAVASHALTLFSDVMNAPNETVKYVRAMTLLEFLGSPDEYKTWKKLKSDIICHVAKDKAEYLRLIERFKELTSKQEDKDPQTGYRTLIVHQGKFLHELLPDPKKRKLLFRELQGYAASVLKDMLCNGSSSWESYTQRRRSLKEHLGVA